MNRLLRTLVVVMLATSGVCFGQPQSDPPSPGSKQALEAALDQARLLAERGESVAARDCLRAAVEKALATLDRHTDAGQTLSGALVESESGDLATELRKLRAAIAEAIVAIEFEPTASAPLPEGFPPPGPVGEICVKRYPAYRGAWTEAHGDLDRAQNRMFFPLFNHIQQQKVEMTAPVEIRYPADMSDGDLREGSMSMAFLYGKSSLGRPGREGAVEVRDEGPVTVVSIGLRGPYTSESMAAALKKLEAWLADHPEYERAGEPRRLAYNGPDVPAARLYSEAQIPVKPTKPAENQPGGKRNS